ncbi:guanine nucleotide binding protein, alpha [Halteromyces radiatus]|uniref:guanine nucleotide binding protein, alpha n=1 Tax=Halteromyces radiatus TaxID=101107 RepID=UPI00221EDF66|nr:guanine nucleotide binding protein, alpha [Halteromyces radiatus]KAI8099059.1 guanine nucleotide binding protein, alpha [Halteromyces radiatus]
MGNHSSLLSKHNAKVETSKTIDKKIHRDHKRMKKEIKILLLGAGESGKSTVLKQMRLIHAAGFREQERLQYRSIIYENIYSSMQMMILALKTSSNVLDDPTLEVYLPLFENNLDLHHHPFPLEYLEPLQALWLDGGLQRAYHQSTTMAFQDNLPYFFQKLQVLWDRDYVPSDQDIIRSRVKTTGITGIKFSIGPFMYHLIDVGGQRSERKKWLHYFENVTAVLFVVAISGYDQVLIEDQDSNQMHEALMLFNTICNSSWFTTTSMIILLNKIDVFKRKILISPVSHYFVDYTGSDDNLEQTKAYFKKRFERLNQNSKKRIYTHFTDATDAFLLQQVMMAVSDIILSEHVNDFIL